MRKIKLLLILIVSCLFVFSLSSCRRENTVQYNLLKETGDFKTYRKITVINLRSDRILMEFEGYLTTKLDSETDVNIMILIGPDKYQLHYVRLADEVTYVCEQLDNTTTDPYHWRVSVYAVLPDISIG